MKIILAMVSSLDGKITKGNSPNIYEWTSKEDQEYFFSLIAMSNAIIMGSKTYKAVKHRIRLQKKLLRIVLTKNPEKYSHEIVSGQLEFSNESPKELVSRLKKTGYKKILVVGGEKVNTSFLKAKLIDELYLTIEPVVFGKGKNLFEEIELRKSLQLISLRRLNKKGTLLLKYSY